MRVVFWLSIFWLAFLAPFHAFPFPDLFNSVGGMLLAAVALFVAISFQSDRTVNVPHVSLALLALLGLMLLSAAGQAGPTYSVYSYAVFMLSGLLVLIVVVNLPGSPDNLLQKLAVALQCIAVITALYGLLRHYGILKLIVPWITSDSDRLIGPLNQANLTALVLAFGVAAVCYRLMLSRLTLWPAVTIAGFLSVAASLTGSRAFLAFIVLIVLAPTLKLIADKLLSPPALRIDGRKGRYILLTLMTCLLIAVAFPIVDRPISSVLIERGLVERNVDASIADRLSGSKSHRLEEWRKLQVYQQVVEEPWTGVGPGRYGTFSSAADAVLDDPARMGLLWTHGHNLFINLLVELGYLGLAAILLVFAYILMVIKRLPSTPGNLFSIAILSLLFFNNLVEFSFWHFGFFALGLSVFALFDGRITVQFSSRVIPVSLSALILTLSVVTALYVGGDAWASVRGFHKPDLTESENIALVNSQNNVFVGGNAYKADILRRYPSLFGIEAQMTKLEHLMKWRPEMVFMIRYSVLRSVVGPEDEACEFAERTLRLYPKSLERLSEELDRVKASGATFDLQHIHGCMARGMMYWVEQSALKTDS